MALIAHYPLNGGTEDYSGYGNDLTPHGFIPSDEFIGAHKTTTNSDYLITSKEWVYDQEVTLAIWAKETGKDGSGIAGLISDHHHSPSPMTGITIYNSGANQLTFAVGLGTSRPSYSFTHLFDSSEWCHYAVTYNNGLVKVYQNGAMLGSREVPPIVHVDGRVGVLGRWSPSYSTYNLVGSLSDARVYDHALSDKEVKELAKAKVLHYKFDEHEEPTENVWSGNLGIYNNNRVPATLVDTGKTFKGAKILRLGMTVDSANSASLGSFRSSLSSHGVMGGGMTFLANTKYAASILWRPVNKSDVIVGGTASNIQGWVSKGSSYEGDGWNRFTVVRNGTVTTDKRDSMFFSFICPSMQLDETVFVEFCAPQVEVGKDYSTPYVMGTRHGSVKDSSGFGNDGTVAVATAPSWSEDSPVGRGSMDFSGSKFIDANHKIPLWDDSTISFWVNITSTNTATLWCSRTVTGKGFSIFSINGVIRWDTGDQQWTTGHAVKLNQWVHYTFVKRGNAKELYENAVLVKSTSYAGSMTNLGNSYSIGMSQVGGSGYDNPLNGAVSDYRIYATALTPEDILELYQTRASIDDLGNLFVHEFDEVSGDALGINSQGIAKFTSINEVGRPVRYIRDWLNGSTANTGNHWVEIQAIDPSGTNVAKGKTSPSALITDGSTASNPYYSGGSSLNSVTVDLGAAHNITYLHIWHYWADRRTYHKTKTEVSTDGTNWVTVFDSAVEGEYAESSDGKKILLYPDKASFGSDGNIYTNEILEN